MGRFPEPLRPVGAGEHSPLRTLTEYGQSLPLAVAIKTARIRTA